MVAPAQMSGLAAPGRASPRSRQAATIPKPVPTRKPITVAVPTSVKVQGMVSTEERRYSGRVLAQAHPEVKTKNVP